MTAFVAEGKRLGIFHPSDYAQAGRIFFGPSMLDKDSEGLCVTGCDACRNFRNKVRAALEESKTWQGFAGYDEPPFDYELTVDFGPDVRSDTFGGRWEFEFKDVTAFLQAVSTERLVAELNDRFNA